MSTLVVQAHPVDDSFNGAMLGAAVSGLTTAGVEHQVVRLSHGELLDPVSVRDMAHLVFVYPTWWGSTPAMLLGPLQRLLGDWIDGHAPTATSPIRSVRRLTVITSHGSSRLINRLQGEPGLQLWKRTMLKLCAPGAAFDWVALYKIDQDDARARLDFLDQIRGRLAGITSSS